MKEGGTWQLWNSYLEARRISCSKRESFLLKGKKSGPYLRTRERGRLWPFLLGFTRSTRGRKGRKEKRIYTYEPGRRKHHVPSFFFTSSVGGRRGRGETVRSYVFVTTRNWGPFLFMVPPRRRKTTCLRYRWGSGGTSASRTRGGKRGSANPGLLSCRKGRIFSRWKESEVRI